MSRKRRSHLPGAVFHLTARTQGQQPWFTPPLRTQIVEYIAVAVRQTNADLLAYAIMPNHFHLLLRQGRWPLWWFMQPLLRRIALLVHRSVGVEGHVFERRYRDRPCLDPDYLRNAVVYTHLNPVRASLAEHANQYVWSSHGAYLAEAGSQAPMPLNLAVSDGLRLFAPARDSSISAMRAAYSAYIAWRMEMDAVRAAEACGVISLPARAAPALVGGDACWSERFAVSYGPDHDSNRADADVIRARPDPEDIAVRTLEELGTGVSLDELRSSYRARRVAQARWAVVRRMSGAGLSGRAIARYLRVSVQCVSNVLRSTC